MFAASDLYPGIEPFRDGFLDVGDGHSLYWETVGNPAAPPVLFLHGGPGAGCGAVHRRFFDPQAWQVVLFDQRGAGRSRPLGMTEANTTAHLIDDIEKLRVSLGIAQWVLFGGSWGSTLALAYAQAHPGRVTAMVLRGVFLGRPQEIEWFFGGIRAIFPDAHADFVGHLRPAERSDILGSYHARLFDPDPRVHRPAAHAWCQYEARCSTLLPPRQLVTESARPETLLALARIEAHYFRNAMFLPPDGLLSGTKTIAAIPGVIVQGRYDMVCPPASAWALSRVWPAARLRMVAGAGHS
ncbi:prolyl aminopeptidase, partial [Ameyamaea chiangmaiensis]